ncbi:MAG: oligosaccharide flippase family protein [Rikenellaceae bacterium]
MLTKLYIKYIKSGDLRYSNLKKNVFWSFIIKGVSILLGLIKVPILLSYLNPDKYGVWLTVSSIVMWVSYFDLGLGHGLRNKLAEALANNDKAKADGLISTAYIAMSLIMILVIVILSPIVLNIDWNNLLNIDVSSISAVELKHTVLLTLIMFCFRFIFQLISIMLKAIQKSAISDAFFPIGSIISLVLILLLKYLHPNSLLLASASISVVSVIVLFVANFIFFNKYFSEYKLRFNKFSKVYFKDIFSLGGKFFIGQICSLILFSSQNLIISKMIGPQEVTVFNITRTYFNLPLMFFTLILTPYWSAITEAYVKGEILWIKTNMRKLLNVSILFSFGLIVMLLLSKFAFKIWVGDSVQIPSMLSLIFVIYNVFILFDTPFTYFLNGVGKLNITVVKDIVKIILFIPTAIGFINIFSTVGLLLALFIINIIPNIILDIIQYRKIISGTARGVWNK